MEMEMEMEIGAEAKTRTGRYPLTHAPVGRTLSKAISKSCVVIARMCRAEVSFSAAGLAASCCLCREDCAAERDPCRCDRLFRILLKISKFSVKRSIPTATAPYALVYGWCSPVPDEDWFSAPTSAPLPFTRLLLLRAAAAPAAACRRARSCSSARERRARANSRAGTVCAAWHSASRSLPEKLTVQHQSSVERARQARETVDIYGRPVNGFGVRVLRQQGF